MQTNNPPPEALLARHVRRAQARRPPGRAVVHVAAAQPLSGRAGNAGDRTEAASDRDSKQRCPAPTGREPRCDRAGHAAAGPRARPPGCRSTRSRSSSSSRRARSRRWRTRTSRICRAGRSRAASCATTRGCSTSIRDLLVAHLPDAAQAPALGLAAAALDRRDDGRAADRACAEPSFARWLIPLVLVALHRRGRRLRVVSRRTGDRSSESPRVPR